MIISKIIKGNSIDGLKLEVDDDPDGGIFTADQALEWIEEIEEDLERIREKYNKIRK